MLLTRPKAATGLRVVDSTQRPVQVSKKRKPYEVPLSSLSNAIHSIQRLQHLVEGEDAEILGECIEDLKDIRLDIKDIFGVP